MERPGDPHPDKSTDKSEGDGYQAASVAVPNDCAPDRTANPGNKQQQ